MVMALLQALVLSAGLNGLLIAAAQGVPLLTRSGWFHAWILGTVLGTSLGWRGWLAVVLYLALGSAVTKLGFARKQALGIAEARGGQRGPENVWGSAATGAVLALLCLLPGAPRELLLLGFSASFAAKLADTCGSEIGKRWGRTTVSLTRLRVVPAGTEGAVSLEGTAASLAGAVVFSGISAALGLIAVSVIPALSALAWLATLIESLIGIGVLRRPLFFQARQLIIRTAERNGIPWRQRREDLRVAAQPLVADSTSPGVQPPDYYLARFHAYEQGNLCWQAAAEAEQATDAMALRVWPDQQLTPAAAQTKLRDAIHAAVEPLLSGRLQRVLDLGCSVGVSTQALARWLTEDHAWFTSYAPSHDAQVIIVVFVEHGGSGSKHAGPIAKRITLATEKLGYLAGAVELETEIDADDPYGLGETR